MPSFKGGAKPDPPVPESPVLSERKTMVKSPVGAKSAFWPSYENPFCGEAMPFTPCTITFLYTDPVMKTHLTTLIRESLKASPKRPLP